jgi:hypothetical protein
MASSVSLLSQADLNSEFEHQCHGGSRNCKVVDRHVIIQSCISRYQAGRPYFFRAEGSTYPHPNGVQDMSVAQ